MIIGVGCDLVRTERIAKAVRNPHFLERIYSEAEIMAMEKSGLLDEFAAGRWAAKEAVAKAMGCGISLCPPCDVEILPDVLGKPCVSLKDAALERMHTLGGSSLQLSISHEGGFSMAFAVLEE